MTALHYLRIAVTALGLMACVLLVALWVRSYYRGDLLYVKLYGWEFKTFSTQGFTQSENYTGTDDGENALFKLQYDTFPPDEAPSLWFDFNKSCTELGFTYITTEEGDYLILRNWPIALLFAVIAVIPWLRWRFSLRTPANRHDAGCGGAGSNHQHELTSCSSERHRPERPRYESPGQGHASAASVAVALG